MQLGMVGLGRMGANMVRRLMKNGHQCVVFDVTPKAVQDSLAKARPALPRCQISSANCKSHAPYGS